MPRIEDGTSATGISINNIHNLFLVESFKSEILINQSLGRGIRLHKDKKFLNVIDFVDDFTYINDYGYKSENYMIKHMKDRIKIYNDSKFPYEIKEIKL